MDYVSTILQRALKSPSMTSKELDDVISILSRVGYREMPTTANLWQILVQVAKHEFQIVPIGALYGLHSGDHFGNNLLFMIYINCTKCSMQPQHKFLQV
jgi:hypothetical protein